MTFEQWLDALIYQVGFYTLVSALSFIVILAIIQAANAIRQHSQKGEK